MVALGAAAKFGSAALAPLFATATGERRWRSAILFAIAFVAVTRAPGPALPPRRRPARVLRPHARLPGLAKLAVQRLGPGAVARLPAAGRAGGRDRRSRSRSRCGRARKTPAQVAALAAAVLIAVQLGATHWFYFYVVWFLPLVLAALFVGASAASGAQPIRRLQPPQGRRADHDLVAGLQPDAGLAGRCRRPAGVPVETMSPGSRVISVREVRDQRRHARRSGRRWTPPASARRSGSARRRSAVVRARPRRA